jgi:hypothetical protein
MLTRLRAASWCPLRPHLRKILHCVDEVTATPAITPLSQVWEIGIAFDHELPAGRAEVQ